jgi:hypothetical protein
MEVAGRKPRRRALERIAADEISMLAQSVSTMSDYQLQTICIIRG